jgi:hypothetical protein
MLRVRSHVRLPKVFEVVVVRGRASALDFRQYATAICEAEYEVGPGVRHESLLWGQHNLLAKPQLTLE